MAGRKSMETMKAVLAVFVLSTVSLLLWLLDDRLSELWKL